MENIKLAIEKLENEIEDNDDNNALVRIGNYLLDACKDSKMLSEAVINDKKSLEKAYEYIRKNAQKQAVNGCACIDDDTVFEWAVDYYLEQEVEQPKPVEKPKKISKPKTAKRTKTERNIEQQSKQINGQVEMFF